MKYIQEFCVVGKGSFPMDMLRYDHCWPDNEESSTVITAEDWNGPGDSRTVWLKRHVDEVIIKPTNARWLSFGWKVLDTKTRKL